jgi:hypothetical protein
MPPIEEMKAFGWMELFQPPPRKEYWAPDWMELLMPTAENRQVGRQYGWSLDRRHQ